MKFAIVDPISIDEVKYRELTKKILKNRVEVHYLIHRQQMMLKK